MVGVKSYPAKNSRYHRHPILPNNDKPQHWNHPTNPRLDLCFLSTGQPGKVGKITLTQRLSRRVSPSLQKASLVQLTSQYRRLTNTKVGGVTCQKESDGDRFSFYWSAVHDLVLCNSLRFSGSAGTWTQHTGSATCHPVKTHAQSACSILAKAHRFPPIPVISFLMSCSSMCWILILTSRKYIFPTITSLRWYLTKVKKLLQWSTQDLRI